MYRNRMSYCGNLTADPKIFEPRSANDKVMFSYTVCQSFPRRNQETGMTEESKMFINCQTRLEPSKAERFRRLLKKGVFIDVEGPLVIESKDTPNGKVSYIHINTSTAQFPPLMSSQGTNNDKPSEPKPAPTSAEERPEAFNPARFADEDE